MPKNDLIPRVTVGSVSLKKDKSYTSYKDSGKNTSDLKEIMKVLKDAKFWGAELKVDQKKEKATATTGVVYPNVPGHPGHVDPGSKGWKYNVERGNSTVDRLFCKATASLGRQEVTEVKKGKVVIRYLDVTVSVSASISVEEDTH
ncbi:MAG: hypothetical protein H6732_07835 [Alphaproteobacteria bacterium]|nr:hypothetical protein [Alphaproteobacteria bacterium]